MVEITHDVVQTESGKTVVSRLFENGNFVKAVSEEVDLLKLRTEAKIKKEHEEALIQNNV